MASDDDQTLVIGLGRFGRALASTLTRLGNEVLGVDASPKVVQACALDLTHVVQADATDVEALRQLGAADFGRAAVAIGTDIQASILATYALVDLGVPRIWAKAVTAEHGAILQRVGAHSGRLPGDRDGRAGGPHDGRPHDRLRRARRGLRPDRDHGARASSSGQTLKDAGLRKRYGVTVVAVKPPGGPFTYATPGDGRAARAT